MNKVLNALVDTIDESTEFFHHSEIYTTKRDEVREMENDFIGTLTERQRNAYIDLVKSQADLLCLDSEATYLAGIKKGIELALKTTKIK